MYPDYRDLNPKQAPKYPPSAPPPVPNYGIKPERGGCLLLWLVLSSGATMFAVVGFLWIVDMISSNPLAARRISGFWVFMLGILLLANIGALVGVWKWQRWGVHGIAVIAIASPFIEVMMGTVTAIDFITPFIQLGVLYFVVKDKWDYFD